MNKLSLRTAVGAAVVGAVLAGTSVALADGLIVGEDDVVATNSDLPMGEVCATNGADGYNGGNDQEVNAWLFRQHKATGGGANPSVVWADGQNVTITAPESHANISTTVASPGYIAIPAGWDDDQTHDSIGPLATTVRVETTELGALVGTGPQRKITMTASGTSFATTTHSDTNDVEVTATIVDETTAALMDCTLPTAAITNPVTPQPDYVQGSTQNAAYTCTDPTVGAVTPSGVDSCDGVVTKPDTTTVAVASESALPTADLGVYTLSVTPTDEVGNVGAAVSRTYRVVAAPSLTGTFGQPIDGNGVINKGKMGRVIPVKLEVFDGQTEVENGDVPSVRATTVLCSVANTDSIETYSAGSANSGFTFRWDSSGGHWIYNLDTSKLPGATANKCFRIDADVNGSSIGSFLIQLTK